MASGESDDHHLPEGELGELDILSLPERDSVAMRESLFSTWEDFFFKGVAPILLIIGSSSLGIVVVLSQENGKQLYSVHTVVLCAEIVKFIVCFLTICFSGQFSSLCPSSRSLSLPAFSIPQTNQQSPKNSRFDSNTPTQTSRNPWSFEELFPYSVPALVYAIDNSMGVVLLQFFSPPVKLVLSNIRVLVTGIVYSHLFQKKLEQRQWIALTVIMIGITMVGFRPEEHSKNLLNVHPIGIFLLFAVSLLSAFGNVYCEKLFKGSDLPLPIQNMKLYFFGILINFLALGLNDREELFKLGPFHHFNGYTVLAILNMAFLGLLVSVVFKYLSSIADIICSVLSAVLNSFLAVMIGVFQPTVYFFYGAAIVFSGVYLYASSSLKHQKQNTTNGNTKIVENERRTKSQQTENSL